jgi:hypothetical protein
VSRIPSLANLLFYIRNIGGIISVLFADNVGYGKYFVRFEQIFCVNRNLNENSEQFSWIKIIILNR